MSMTKDNLKICIILYLKSCKSCKSYVVHTVVLNPEFNVTALEKNKNLTVSKNDKN